MKITAIVAKADVPNKNNRVYPLETLQSIVDQFNNKDVGKYGMLGMSGNIENTLPLDKISHTTDALHIDGSSNLVANVTVLSTPMGERLKDILSECEFRLGGIGKLTPVDSQSNVSQVSDYTLVSINAIPKNDAA